MEIRDIIIRDFSQETKDSIRTFVRSYGKINCNSKGSLKNQVKVYINSLKTISG